MSNFLAACALPGFGVGDDMIIERWDNDRVREGGRGGKGRTVSGQYITVSWGQKCKEGLSMEDPPLIKSY
ncbi:hypothetical protein PBY51_024038 [Eleginops maclovinus]|uniref:Uncharacterized protein n=1 Tax=Eleginops maclovinus TaxID=56733 RepID=A0AAN7XYL9_ELEMC|nr:hypothetical protein PBY51_024038 [Eleginops maclovinus]